MKIVGKHWFTGVSVFGIIVVETEVGERKAYMGLGYGDNEAEDARHIAMNGTPVMLSSVEAIVKELKGG